MKKYLLPNEGNFYKANLHCHSILSDGSKTPQELKELYQALGYSVLAYTDHDIFLPHNDLTDDHFLALNGFEVEIDEENQKPFHQRKTCHICFIALDEKTVIQPMWNEAYLFDHAPKSKDLVQFDAGKPPYVRTYNGETISEMMKIGRDEGFFVTYNHPEWSKETYKEYMAYDGMHAMEMFNGNCMVTGYEDYNPRVYDDLLSSGKKIYCIGADDNHNYGEENSRNWDSGIAFTMIKSKDLTYSNIANALVHGEFYCSEGPEIYSLWVENGKLHIECSEADRIICSYECRRAGVVYAENNTPVTKASFHIGEDSGYVRITVIDKHGKHACTNAYFLDSDN